MRGLYPGDLQINDFKPGTNKKFSNAEFLVYQDFEELTKYQDLFAIYSFRLEHHVSKRQGEIDFIVLSPQLGIIVLEVKGSKIKKEVNGDFYCFDRSNSTWEHMQNPFKQAEENAFSLLSSLSELFKILRKRPLVTWGCIFPENDLVLTGLDVPSWRFLNHDKFLQELYPSLLEISAQEKKKAKLPYDTLSELDMKAIVELLVGKAFEGNLKDMDTSQGLKHLAQFTSSQYKVLDELADNDRVFFIGAAGTGKTFLAIQEFKRLWETGLSTCLVVMNKHLQSWMQAVIATTHPGLQKHVYVYEDIIKELQSETGFSPYQAMIIDEVQDILFNNGLKVTATILGGGLGEGTWRFFGDPLRQSISVTQQDVKAALRENGVNPSNIVNYRLRLNVRNTRRINEALRKAIDLSETELLPNDYSGENISFLVFSPGELAAKLNSQVRKLLLEGHPPHRVSIIIPSEMLIQVEQLLEFEYSRMNDVDAFTQLKGITVGEEIDFKGLENDFVIYVLPCAKTQDVKQRIYIGMSRARLRLMLLCPAAETINYLHIIKTTN